MKVEVEKPSPCKRILKVEIPQNVVDAAFKEAYDEVRREARIPGFRPGKAPTSVLRARYGDYVRMQVMEKLFKEYYEKALEEAGLNPATEPEFSDVTFEEGKPFTFTATMEVHPDFELKEYTGIEIEKRRYIITETEVERFLNELRYKMAKVEDKGEEPAERGDVVIVNYEAFEGDKPIEGSKTEGATYTLGSGETIEGFDEAIIGKKAGDEFEVTVEFPEDHFNKNLAGKKVTFRGKIVSVKRRIVPELNQEFAKRFDVESVEALKEKAKAQLEEEFERRAKEEAKEQLAQKLVEGYDFPLPESIVEEELKKRLERYEMDLRIRGVEPKEEDLKKAEEEFRKDVERSLRLMYVLKKIAEREELEVTQDDLRERIETMAKRANIPPERLMALMQQTGRLRVLMEEILTDKTLEFLLEKAKVKEVEVVVGEEERKDEQESE